MKTLSGISCWLAAVAVLLTGSLVQGQVPIIRPGQSADLSIGNAPRPMSTVGVRQEQVGAVVARPTPETAVQVAPSIAYADECCACQQPDCHRCRLLQGGQRLQRLGSCLRCGTRCGCVECPSCHCEVCQLTTSETKVKKTCYKVEQETVCIPPVRFPWQECCPPMTSRTRTVNRLTKHTYECPECSYKWSVVKPEAAVSQSNAPVVPPINQPTEALGFLAPPNRR